MDDQTREQRKGQAASSLQEREQAFMGKKNQPKAANYGPRVTYEKTDRMRVVRTFFIFVN